MARAKLEKEEKRSLNKMNVQKLFGIFKYLLNYKARFIVGFIFLIFSSFLLLGFPYVAGKLIDVATGNDSWYLNEIHLIAFILIAILFFQSILSFFRVYLFAQVSEQAMADVRNSLFSRIIFLPISFYDKTRTGELMSRMSADVTLLQTTFSTTLAEIIRQLVTLIVGVIIIFFTTPSLSLFMLATFPVLIIVAIIFGRKIKMLSKDTQEELAKSTTIVEETLQAISTVKTFTNELFEINRFNKSQEVVVSKAIATAKYRGILISFIIFALFGGIVAIMWYGAYLLQNGQMLAGELISFFLYTAFIGGSIAGLGDMYGMVQRAIGASERILEILDEDQEQPANHDTQKLALSGNISFENVQFTYPSRLEVEVIKGVSFGLNPGEKVALVGSSGAGKSTLIQLLMRLYTINKGSIKVDGKDIQEYDLSAFRKNIGIVPQEVILFGGSIQENIGYGKLDATLEEIKMAAQKANALDFIESFPEGFDTLVGERGVKLSGGQRQRIAIARAILKDPSILILDEATSSLDAKSEKEVQDALDELMKNRTTIIIAHRLATIRKVDRIYVLEGGEIIESGNHEELSAKVDGVYENLVKLQFSEV
ncbi:MAG: ABC transporter fused permease/ATP-binding protein [Cyclobacteriaceae bacterium]|jgi:ABC transporter fused permease/ATP-binding protein